MRFAREAEQALIQTFQKETGNRSQLARQLRQVEAAIERLLDRLEGDEPGEALFQRLHRREIERDQLSEQIANIEGQVAPAIPSAADLEAAYQAQVARLETLLTGSDQIIEANGLLKDLLGEVCLWGDPDARDRMRIEILSNLARLLQDPEETQKSALKGAFLLLGMISVVAEPRLGHCFRKLADIRIGR